MKHKDWTIVSSALSSKAAAYMDSGKPEQAMLALIKSIQKDPYNSNAYINLAILFRDKIQMMKQ